jgi:hypothetical protein
METLRNELQALADSLRSKRVADAKALAATRPPMQPANPMPGPTLDDYRKALAGHDWTHEYADDYTAWCRGRDSLARLRTMARTLDPDRTIWREYMPKA